MVGGNQAGDDRLAESGAGVDDDLVPRARHRVGGEQHPRHLRRHQALDHDGELHRLLVEPLALAVGDGALAPERGPAAPHGVQQRLRTDDVKEGVLLAGERRLRQVLGRRARAHRDRALPEPVVRCQDVSRDLRRDRSACEGVADGGAAAARLTQRPGDRLAQAVVGHKAVVGRRGHDEAGRDREAGADQLAQVGALAAGHREIATPQLVQRQDERRGTGGCRAPGRAARPSLVAHRLPPGRAAGPQPTLIMPRRLWRWLLPLIILPRLDRPPLGRPARPGSIRCAAARRSCVGRPPRPTGARPRAP